MIVWFSFCAEWKQKLYTKTGSRAPCSLKYTNKRNEHTDHDLNLKSILESTARVSSRAEMVFNFAAHLCAHMRKDHLPAPLINRCPKTKTENKCVVDTVDTWSEWELWTLICRIVASSDGGGGGDGGGSGDSGHRDKWVVSIRCQSVNSDRAMRPCTDPLVIPHGIGYCLVMAIFDIAKIVYR